MSYEKVSNALPSLGGITGVSIVAFPSFHTIINAGLLALITGIVGAVAGYYVKMILDKIYKK